MSGYERPPGSLNVTIEVFFFTISTGVPVPVTSATAGLNIDYTRVGETKQDMPTINDLATLDAAHNDGGILLMGDGVHRLDLPDAVCASGVKHATIHGGATGIAMIPVRIDLVGNDPFVALNDFDPATETVLLATATQNSIDNIEALLIAQTETVAIGTVQTVTSAGEYTMSTNLSASDNHYQYMFAVPQDGPAAGQPRVISSYTGASRTVFHSGTGTQLTRPYSVALEVGNTVHIKGLVGTL